MSSKRNRKRCTFTEKFKLGAVNVVVVEGYAIAAAAVNVLDGSLREWHRKYAPEPSRRRLGPTYGKHQRLPACR